MSKTKVNQAGQISKQAIAKKPKSTTLRVICINNKPIPFNSNRELNLITEGKTYTVKKEVETTNLLGRPCIGYSLAGIRGNKYYGDNRFIRLVDTSSEIANSYKSNGN